MPSGDYNRLKTHCPHGHPYDTENTGIANGHRYCKACRAAFQRSKGKAYQNAKAARWYKNNPDKVKHLHRAANLKKFGLTIPQYDQMEASQNGVCAICGGISRSDTRLAVDHDHNTGVVRGLLCENCNPGLGLFNDNPQLLRSAAKYLISHG